MFVLTVESESKELLEYFAKESDRLDAFQYAFSSAAAAAEKAARFALRHLRAKLAESMVSRSLLAEEEKQEFFEHLKGESMAAVFADIKGAFETHFAETNELHFEGFLRFRLRQPEKAMDRAFGKAYESYSDSDSESVALESIKRILAEQPSLSEEARVAVSDAGLVLKTEQGEEFFSSSNALMNRVVQLSPKRLMIFDPKDSLSKEAVIVLCQVFEERVRFFREQYAEH